MFEHFSMTAEESLVCKVRRNQRERVEKKQLQ